MKRSELKKLINEEIALTEIKNGKISMKEYTKAKKLIKDTQHMLDEVKSILDHLPVE